MPPPLPHMHPRTPVWLAAIIGVGYLVLIALGLLACACGCVAVLVNQGAISTEDLAFLNLI